MRQLLAVVLALASGAAGCCFQGTAPEGGPAGGARRAAEAPGGHGIVLDMALVERPAGDDFLNQGVWDLGNEQCVDLEVKPLLEENGLRVGLIGGMLPPRLQALLKSPRTCPDPRRLRAEPDQPTPFPVGPPRARLAFQSFQAGQGKPVELADANCSFGVTPALAGEGGVRLRFLPRIRHGKAKAEPQVARDADGSLRWAVEAKEPVEEFPHLAWELPVNADEYVLIGGRCDRPGTLGASYFLTADGKAQKLLVLRAARLSSRAVDENLTQSPPLALQAVWTARGSAR
ncbi:MAG: hypothetical protein U0797_22805 [Gemmataceae bacterium]